MRRSAESSLLAAATLLAASLTLPATAEGRWRPDFHLNGLPEFTKDALVYDDGSGPALYLAGGMTTADDVLVNFLARWDGTRMSAVGGGFDAPVHALAAFDDGSGMALYAGGSFQHAGGVPAKGIARWNGAAWEAIDQAGFDPAVIWDLHVWDDGEGPALYAAGRLELDVPIGPGEVAKAGHIAKWNGKSWSALRFGVAGGVSTSGQSMVDFDDGSGSDLYLLGTFSAVSNTEDGDTPARNIGRWDGESWSAVGAGLTNPRTMTVFDFGSGPSLIAATDFGPVRWNGSVWSPFGTDLIGAIQDFEVFDDGGGPKLYAGGAAFDEAPNGHRRSLVRWQDGDWAPVGPALSGFVSEMVVVPFGEDPGLYFGGTFRMTGPAGLVYGLARWDGSTVESVTGAAPGKGAEDTVYALAAMPGVLGGRLFAGGEFSAIGAVEAEAVASLATGQWSTLAGSGPSLIVDELAIFGDGNNASVITATRLPEGETQIDRFARWDGASWHAMGAFPAVGDNVRALLSTAIEEPPLFAGHRLWFGGDFTTVGGVAGTVNIASWEGTEFSALGSGVGSAGSGGDRVLALAAFDDGGGMDLYAGGVFTSASGVAANRFARWDGTAWTAVDSGFNGAISDLLVHDDGQGAALYAAGFFTEVDGEPITGLARWDGTEWTSVGGAAFTAGEGSGDFIRAMASFDDGQGPKLAIGGRFKGPLSPDDQTLIFWDGTSFSAPAGGQPNGPVRALQVHHDGHTRKLFVGGDFTRIGDLPSAHLAAYDTFLLLEDGFESGDTSAWSAATP